MNHLNPKTDWALLQNLLSVLDAGSLRGASLSNGRSLNTVRARIAELERVTGLVLIERWTKGASHNVCAGLSWQHA